MTSYPASQQHMTHSGFGLNINQNIQEQRAPSLQNNQLSQEPRTSKQQFSIYQL